MTSPHPADVDQAPEPVPFNVPLFLPDDSDEENEQIARRSSRPPAPAVPQDVLDLFNDLDNDADMEAGFSAPTVPDDADDPFTIKPLVSTVDIAALEREARARPLPTQPRSSQPSSSQVRDEASGEEDKEDKAKDEKKPGLRKRIPRLDEGRLLGKDGFPALMKAVKDFKIKGKGHEVQDLDRLFLVYQFWTHQLYPKTQFRDTVERVEKLCHSRRMNVALSVYNDEAHGKTRPEAAVIDLTDDEDDLGDKADEPPASEPITPSSSRPPSEPPASSDGNAFDFDDDEFEAALEAERTGRRPISEAVGSAATSKPKATFGPADDDDLMDVDGEDWDKLIAGAFEVEESNNNGNSQSNKQATNSMADDDDIWDIIDEVQKEQAAGPTPQRKEVSEAEENWEDMYL
ncbi:hypothetical protein ONZ45_g5264 [Pleurotus djamor]|nr:hypothetical protein ONZ45_g5264 [Pleurotus djamor]